MCKKTFYVPFAECLLISDEDEFIKIISYDEANRRFRVEAEYYVHKGFGRYEDLSTLDTFMFGNQMLYSNGKSYMLQRRGTEKTDYDFVVGDVERFNNKTSSFPLWSDSYVLMLLKPNENKSEPYKLSLFPPYNSQKAIHAPGENNYTEFFMEGDQDKIIRVMHEYDRKPIEIQMLYLNGLKCDKVILDQNREFINLNYNMHTTVSTSGEWVAFIRYDQSTRSIWIQRVNLSVRNKDQARHNGDGLAPNSTDGTGTGHEGGSNEGLKAEWDLVKFSISEEIQESGIWFYRIAVTDSGKIIVFNLETQELYFDLQSEEVGENYNYFEEMDKILKHPFKDYQKADEEVMKNIMDNYINRIVISNNYIVFWIEKGIYSFRFNIEEDLENYPYMGQQRELRRTCGVVAGKKINHTPTTGYLNIKLTKLIKTSHPDRFLIYYEFKASVNVIVWDLIKNWETTSFASRENERLMFYAFSTKKAVKEAIEYEKIQEENKTKRKQRSNIDPDG